MALATLDPPPPPLLSPPLGFFLPFHFHCETPEARSWVPPPSWSCACDTNAVIVPNRVDACTCKQKRSWPCVAPGRVNGGCPKFARCYPYYYSCRGVGCFCLSGYTPTYNARKEVVLCTPKTDAAATTKSTSLSAHAASVAEQLGSVRGGGMLGLVSGPARMGLEVAGAVREGWRCFRGGRRRKRRLEQGV
ncbi:hypothetical protein CLOM_g3781 [Closterium sp. NIES-68]|nr:hypothetical protein CLOM_g3781 [Closterium sp. NIES-68]